MHKGLVEGILKDPGRMRNVNSITDTEQQEKLHMKLEGQAEGDGYQDAQAHQLLNVTLLQGGSLPDHWAYLDGCSTMTAFKSNKYLSKLEVMPTGIKINCNAGLVSTKQMGKYGRMKVWYIPDGIANIISMHKLEKLGLLYCAHGARASAFSQGRTVITLH